MKKLWHGRFEARTDARVERFTESISLDSRLAPFDIEGSLAHARMLARQGYLSAAECEKIRRALTAIGREIAGGRLRWSEGDEDIHMFIEAELTRRAGLAGKKLHTARSRNDQVSTDVRLYLRAAIDRMVAGVRLLQKSLHGLAVAGRRVVVPGYTHMQQAQPVLLAHHLIAHIDALDRDAGRLLSARATVNRLPLGACALAGTSLKTDRLFLMRELGFDGLVVNSMDAVASRDHLQETLAALAILGVNLSRLCEEWVLWSTSEFGFITIGDAFCTGSSIMPQKKNPDVAELVRGKAGRLIGNLVNLLVLLKGLPLTYNRDMQEDKAPLFDSVDTVEAVLGVLAGMVENTRIDEAGVRRAMRDDYLLATDLAEYLVDKGMPFRQAHEVVGALVRDSIRAGRLLGQTTLPQLRGYSPLFGADALERLTPGGSIARKRSLGGTGAREVDRQLKRIAGELRRAR